MFEWYMKRDVPDRTPIMQVVWLQAAAGSVWLFLGIAGHSKFSRVNLLTAALTLTAAVMNFQAIRQKARLDSKADFSAPTDNQQS